MKIIQLFCSRCNKVTPSGLSVVDGEYHAVCQNETDGIVCGHTVKFPATASVDELRGMLTAHNTANKPAVTAAMVAEHHATLNSVLDEL